MNNFENLAPRQLNDEAYAACSPCHVLLGVLLLSGVQLEAFHRLYGVKRTKYAELHGGEGDLKLKDGRLLPQ